MKTNKFFYAIFTAMLLMSSISSFCQYFSAGARVGMDFGSLSNFSKINLLDLNNEPGVKRNVHAGFQGGFMATYSFNKIIGLQGELILDRKGVKVTDTYSGFSVVNEISISYLTIPILIKIGTEIGKFKIYGILGPYIGIGLGGKATFGTINTQVSEMDVKFSQEPKDGDNYEHLKRLDVGLAIGVEPEFKLGPGDILLDLRYNFGFLDINNPYQKGDNYYSNANRSFGVSLGYMIPFGK